MPTARDIMTAQAVYCTDDATAADAAAQDGRRRRRAPLPICNTEGRLSGVVTDRDLPVKVVAAGP